MFEFKIYLELLSAHSYSKYLSNIDETIDSLSTPNLSLSANFLAISLFVGLGWVA